MARADRVARRHRVGLPANLLVVREEEKMTTLVATPTALYSDSHCQLGDTSFSVAKMAHIKHSDTEEYLVGGVGVLDEIIFMFNMIKEFGAVKLWKLHLNDNWPPDILTEASFILLIVTRDGKIYTMDNHLVMCEIKEKAFALGCGSEFARSALALTRSPIEAIQFASQHNSHTNLPVQVIEFPNKLHSIK